MSVGGSPVDSDIQTYIEGRLQNDKRLKRWKYSPGVQAEIRTILMEKAGGMQALLPLSTVLRVDLSAYVSRFGWTVCQLDALQNCSRRPILRKALNDLPESLDETYARILNDIPKENAEEAHVMLQWLTHSKRPLTVTELSEVVVINSNRDPWVDCEARFPDPVQDTLSILSSLVTTETDSYDTEKCMIRFAHFSVQEYLVSDRILLSQPVRQYAIRQEIACKSITSACVAYLLGVRQRGFDDASSMEQNFTPEYYAECQSRFEDTSPVEQDFPLEDDAECSSDFEGVSLIEQGSPLEDYAETLWAHHLLDLVKDDIPWQLILTLLQRIKKLHQNSPIAPKFRTAFRKSFSSSINNPLSFAAGFGSIETVQLLLEAGEDINAHDIQHGSPFHAAVTGFADEDLIRIRLKNGADINAQDCDFGSPLKMAMEFRIAYEPILRLLLEDGANPNAKGPSGGTTLHDACTWARQSIIRLLLDYGADVNAKNDVGFPRTAIYAAASAGNEPVVRLLLKYGADPNGEGRDGTALMTAAHWSEVETVRLLLENGANVNSNCG